MSSNNLGQQAAPQIQTVPVQKSKTGKYLLFGAFGCFLIPALCCGTFAVFISLAPSSNNSTTQESVLTPTIQPTAEVKQLIDIKPYLHKAMSEVAKLVGGQVNKGGGSTVDNISIKNTDYDLYIESTSTKTQSSYLLITIKNQPKCNREAYEGNGNFENTLKMVGLDPSLKGTVEPYFGRNYASWTRSYNKVYTVNAGCNSEGYIYLNFGLTKCQSLVNGKPVEGC